MLFVDEDSAVLSAREKEDTRRASSLDCPPLCFPEKTQRALTPIGFEQSPSFSESSRLYNNAQQTQFQSQKSLSPAMKIGSNSIPDSFASEEYSTSMPVEQGSSFQPNLLVFQSPTQALVEEAGFEKDIAEYDNEGKMGKSSQDPATLLPTITEVTPVGIDTLCLFAYVPPGKIRLGLGLKHRSHRDSWRNGLLFIDASGEYVEGRRAYHEDDCITLNIFPVGHYVKARSPLREYSHVVVQFSVAKICGKSDNTCPVGLEETNQAIQEVERRLAVIGVTVDLSSFNVIRLDLFRNIKTVSRNVEPLLDIIKTLVVPRTKKTKYDSTVQDFNKSQTLSVYDKNAEREKRDYKISSDAPGVLRFEWQLKKSGKVQKMTQVKTLSDLLKNFESLHDIFVGHIKETYFKVDAASCVSTRNFSKGNVNQRLDTILERLHKKDLAQSWTRADLRRTFKAYGAQGLKEKLRESMRYSIDSATFTGADGDWLTTRIRELQKAHQQELLSDPAYAALHTTLQHALLGPAVKTPGSLAPMSLLPPSPTTDWPMAA